MKLSKALIAVSFLLSPFTSKAGDFSKTKICILSAGAYNVWRTTCDGAVIDSGTSPEVEDDDILSRELGKLTAQGFEVRACVKNSQDMGMRCILRNVR